MNDVVFRKIHGRIVPIRKKGNDIKNKIQSSDKLSGATLAAGVVVSAGSGYAASNIFKRAYKAYNQSAHHRGYSKLFRSVGETGAYTSAVKNAARLKTIGKLLSIRGAKVAVAGATIGASLAAVGSFGLMKNRTDEKTAASVSAGVGFVSSALGLAVLAKRAKVGHIAMAFKNANPNSRMSEMFSSWSATGQAKTNKLVSNYSIAAEKARLETSRKLIGKINKARKSKKFIDPNQGSLF